MSDVPDWYANLLAAACGINTTAAKELGPDRLSSVFVEDAAGEKDSDTAPPVPLVIDWQNPHQAARDSAQLQRIISRFYRGSPMSDRPSRDRRHRGRVPTFPTEDDGGEHTDE